MHVAGGLYRELCDIPAWNAEYGSGARAAAAVSALSPGSTLHTYARYPNSEGIASLEALGVKVHVNPTNVGIVFAYFHPLSNPHIEPPRNQIPLQEPIVVSGETVLRFGFLEGDAIVSASRAVYDPQTSSNPQPFAANGSTANELALVMNELELRTIAKTDDIAEGVERLMQTQEAAAVVVKAGTRGATVFERGGATAHVPAYRSTKVFKIGTGDVFSAMFSLYWGEQRRPASEAADLASRSVAAYCSTRQLPLRGSEIENLLPIGSSLPGAIWLEGATNTIGRRYTMEEARYRLVELGASVISPNLSHGDEVPAAASYSSLLVIADGMDYDLSDRVHRAIEDGASVVILDEQRHALGLMKLVSQRCTITDDFASALYFAVWAAIAEPSVNIS